MYKVNDVEFKTKELIKNFVKDILGNHINEPLQDKEYEFMKELVGYHDHKYNVEDVIEIMPVHQNVECNIILLKVTFVNKTNKWKNKPTLVSIERCIRGIAPYDVGIIDITLSFGKYKGMKISEINDNNYLNWLVNQPSLHKDLKIKIGQFLRYGFIPYNSYIHPK
jgi:hypothetical protein